MGTLFSQNIFDKKNFNIRETTQKYFVFWKPIVLKALVILSTIFFSGEVTSVSTPSEDDYPFTYLKGRLEIRGLNLPINKPWDIFINTE